MTIEERTILTPGGHTITGDSSRHAFSYVVPERESQAGSKIFMVLLKEETVELHPGGGAEHEICAAATRSAEKARGARAR